MSDEVPNTAVEIMGRVYQIKCSASEIDSLQQSARYLEEKMQAVRNAGVLNADRIIIITALNIVNELLLLEQQKDNFFGLINQQLQALQNKVDNVLERKGQLELQTAE